MRVQSSWFVFLVFSGGGFGFRASDFGCRVSGFGFQDSGSLSGARLPVSVLEVDAES